MGASAPGKFLLVLAIALISQAFSLAAYCQDTDAPVAKLYSNGKVFADVLSIGKKLGNGEFGTVRIATIRKPSGEESLFALRMYRDSIDPAQNASSLTESWRLVRPLGKSDPHGVLNIGIAGLTLVPTGKTLAEGTPNVILSRLAKGSAEKVEHHLWLEDPQSPGFEKRLNVISKYKTQILEAIEILGTHGLIHGDIKPGNVLYFKDPSYDWEMPDSNLIRFALTDFDTVKPIKSQIGFVSLPFAAPEVIASAKRGATPAIDLYSHAVSVYTLIFGQYPFEEYFESQRRQAVRTMDLKTEREHTFSDPGAYNDFLRNVDQKFKSLNRKIQSKSVLQKVNALRKFVLNGLAYSPEERLSAFPRVEKAVATYLKSGEACKREAVSRIQALSNP
jgi:serine/threonine protein kinase